jgi:hypothetical protein
MNQEIPGFGGLFYDREGFANVFLTDPDDARALDQLGPDVRVLQGEFQFNELRAWRHELRSAVLGLPGVVTLDVDESTNRVRVGVDRQARAERQPPRRPPGRPARHPRPRRRRRGGRPDLPARHSARPAPPGARRRADPLRQLPVHPRLQRRAQRRRGLRHQQPLHQQAGRRREHAVLPAGVAGGDRHRDGRPDVPQEHRRMPARQESAATATAPSPATTRPAWTSSPASPGRSA